MKAGFPLLQECFAIAGRQNRESVVEWKKRCASLFWMESSESEPLLIGKREWDR